MPIRERHHAISVVRARPSTQLDEEGIRRDCAQWISDRVRTRPVVDVIQTRRFMFVTIELTSESEDPGRLQQAAEVACTNLIERAAEYGLHEATRAVLATDDVDEGG